MSRIRSRNIRAKISSVSQWSQNLRRPGWDTSEECKHQVLSSTADSGIERGSNDTERLDKQLGDWHLYEEDMDNDLDSSGNTLDVMREIRNIEDSVKSGSAESYNSWSDEYQQCAFPNRVRDELQRMDRVLQGEEGIPAHYDKDEYKLWIKTFPCLRLMPTNSITAPKNNHFSEHFGDSSTSPTLTPSPAKTPPEHLPRINQRPYRRDFNARSSTKHNTTFSSNKHLAINNTVNPRTMDIKLEQSFLQLAPVNMPLRRTSYSGTQNSVKPTAKRYGQRLDWLSVLEKDKHSNNSVDNTLRPRQKSLRKEDAMMKTSEFIVLPPINAKAVRSVSAATLAGSKMPIRLQYPVRPLYETGSDIGGVRSREVRHKMSWK